MLILRITAETIIDYPPRPPGILKSSTQGTPEYHRIHARRSHPTTEVAWRETHTNMGKPSRSQQRNLQNEL